MRRILVDTGPLIALFNKNDSYHDRVLTFLKKYTGRLITTWPVLTEVVYMLDFHPQVKIDFLSWVSEGGLEIFPIETWQINRIRLIMEKYHDLPADLADATLVVVSESINVREILTIDSVFQVYRTEDGKYLENVLFES